MNTRALRSFIKVYERKSISSAAKDLNISPQGLSKVIKQLEYDLGADLFYRGIQGMDATESGELLYARARHICYLLDDIKKELDLLNKHSGALTVIVSYSATAIVPVQKILGFSDLNPLIQVQLKEYPDGFPFGESFQDEVDVGIIVGVHEFNNCKQDLLYEGETVILVPQGHPLSSRSEISLSDLDGESLVQKLVTFGGDTRFQDTCEELGVFPTITYETDNHNSIHTLCKTKGYLAISIDFIEDQLRDPQLCIVRIKEKIPQNIYLISRYRESQNRAVSLFLDYIKKETSGGCNEV